jgi:hypothetical protein
VGTFPVDFCWEHRGKEVEPEHGIAGASVRIKLDHGG